MFYIFDKSGFNTGFSDFEPDFNDLKSRDEFSVETDTVYTHKIEYKQGKIVETVNTPESSTSLQKRLENSRLTRYQFFRGLLEFGYDSGVIETQINLIQDDFKRKLTIIGFKDAGHFVRSDEIVLEIQEILNISNEDLDSLWEHSLKL